MNKPDDKLLNAWLNGELEGESLEKMESWAEVHAGDLDAEFKCNIGWDALCDEQLQAIPDSVEPPYPEFFNHKLKQVIEGERDEYIIEKEEAAVIEPSIWQKLRWMVLPTAVAAGVAFYAGSQMKSQLAPATNDPVVIASYKDVYIPDDGVIAAVSESDAATEIVLNGLSPISDDVDVSAFLYRRQEQDFMMIATEGDQAEAFDAKSITLY